MKKSLIITFLSLLVFAACNTPATTSETFANYPDYNEATLIQSLQQGPTVLYFYASWCPTCHALNKEIIENHDQLPANATIIKVDYDNSDELKKQYGVTTQHTLILLNKDSSEAKKWVGGNFESILEAVNEA